MSPDADQVLQLILSRRSVREGYLDQPVPRSVLEAIVACGLAGPSSKAANPVRLAVVTDKARLAALSRSVATDAKGPAYTPHDPTTGLPHLEWQSTVPESAAVLARVPAAIFVSNAAPFSRGRRALLDADPKARELALTGFELELAGLGAALENMWLAALAHGLSAAFLGDVGVVEEEVRRMFGLEGDLLGVLVLGQVQPTAGPPTRIAPDPAAVRWDP